MLTSYARSRDQPELNQFLAILNFEQVGSHWTHARLGLRRNCTIIIAVCSSVDQPSSFVCLSALGPHGSIASTATLSTLPVLVGLWPFDKSIYLVFIKPPAH